MEWTDGVVNKLPYAGMRLMRTAGYVYMERDETDSDLISRDIVWLDGRTTSLEPRPLATYAGTIPSPDGSYLAEVVANGDHDPLTNECGSRTTCAITVRFRDVASGELASEPVTFTMDGIVVPLWVVWTADDTLIVGEGYAPGDPRTRRGVGVGLDGRVWRDLPAPRCADPATTSSEIAGDGRTVEASLVGGEVVLVIHEGESPGYPTRCWPFDSPSETGP